MRLIKPTSRYESSWKKALKEFEKEGVVGFWNVLETPSQLESYLQLTTDHAQGKSLPEDWVPASTFWLIDQDRFVGHCNIRHRLKGMLRDRGGHIGYAIPPSQRRKGYGRKILQLALQKAKALGLRRALVTCDDDHLASQRIIESNGGKLRNKVKVEGKLVRRYWVDLR